MDAIPNRTYHGEVVEVSQAGDTTSGAVNFTVTIQLTDADASVKPGMTVAVNIVTKQIKDQLLVPNRAVRVVNNQRVVYILQNGAPSTGHDYAGSFLGHAERGYRRRSQGGRPDRAESAGELRTRWWWPRHWRRRLMDWVVDAKDITKVYKMGEVEVQALRGASLQIGRGEVVAIMGPSGSGKSTMMNILGCLDRPTSGEYSLDGEAVATLNDDQLAGIRNRKVGFVFQIFNLLPRQSALANVELPLRYAGLTNGRRTATRDRLLEAVGLATAFITGPWSSPAGSSSASPLPARIVNEPAIIMADEPTGNLDSKVGKEIMSVLLNLNKRKRHYIDHRHP